MSTAEKVTIQAVVNAPIEKVWDYFNNPDRITKWNFASDDWHSPSAENDLRVGGKLLARMEAKDGSFGFDFWGIYSTVDTYKHIAYTLGDGRKATIDFDTQADGVHISETFEAESVNPVDMQKGGWQAILNSFKNYTENN